MYCSSAGDKGGLDLFANDFTSRLWESYKTLVPPAIFRAVLQDMCADYQILRKEEVKNTRHTSKIKDDKEAIIQRIKELTLPLDKMSNERDKMRLSELAAGYSSMGVEAEKALQIAREGCLWKISVEADREGLPRKMCYDLYKQAQL
jgi:hypothetical protein